MNHRDKAIRILREQINTMLALRKTAYSSSADMEQLRNIATEHHYTVSELLPDLIPYVPSGHMLV